jgi:hypothetical protein
MMRQLMDEVRYRREGGRNVLTLTKRFTGQMRQSGGADL